MKLWLVRAGKHGIYESKFLEEGRIYLTWSNLQKDLSKFDTRDELINYLLDYYSDEKKNTIRNWAFQIWFFAKEISIGDWVVLPSKKKASVHFGKVTGDYVNVPSAENPLYHYRKVDWFATDIPRSNFDQDILYSFGAFLTICRIKRNNAEARIEAMAKNDWKSVPPGIGDIEEELEELYDIERVARDQIAKHIEAKFKGHGMARLVEEILKAQGYIIYRSPEGPDKGVDLLAAKGSLGFESPRLCVQVKSGSSAVDRPTLDQLIGAMQNFNAEQGLLVSWGGFKTSVDKEVPQQFFRVRLWDQDAVLEELFKVYDKMDEEIKAELQLKRVWALTLSEEE